MIPYEYAMTLSAILFAIGAIGIVVRRNILVLLMCVELLLNAVNIAFVATSDYLDSAEGLIYVFFVMTVAAAEAAVGLAIVLNLYRYRNTVYAEDVDLLKG
ncbi:MAG: NADH-quinone oxidoreductase subunit NuoK [Deltaproteobacteria bacterium]|nr:MAG: NADH-quinone oxidoreductase subunit NuoK [Deltaproteobacteria bacterium]